MSSAEEYTQFFLTDFDKRNQWTSVIRLPLDALLAWEASDDPEITRTKSDITLDIPFKIYKKPASVFNGHPVKLTLS